MTSLVPIRSEPLCSSCLAMDTLALPLASITLSSVCPQKRLWFMNQIYFIKDTEQMICHFSEAYI